jgi:hypothetical protein
MFISALFFRYLRPLRVTRDFTTRGPWRGALLVACALLFSGCTMARLGYDLLPAWSSWQLDRYLGLDEDQRALVSRRVDEIHRWHRRGQLPGYAEFLGEVEAQLRVATPGASEPVAVGRWRLRVTEAWAPLAERLAPAMAELALTLRPDQIERLRRRLAEADEEYREKFLPEKPAERIAARADRVVKRAEFFLGRLEGNQERELRQMAAAMPPTEELWYAERQRRNQALLGLLTRLSRERPPAAEATRQVREALLVFWTPADPGRRQRLDEAVALSDQLSTQLLARASAAQRAHLLKTLRGYAQDFVRLAAL